MRFKLFSALFALLTVMTAPAFAQDTKDLGFEAGTVGETPASWLIPSPGWKAELTKEKAAKGDHSIKFYTPRGSEAPFGNLMLAWPAPELARHHVTLTAKLLVEGEGTAQMWLRVDRKGGAAGAFDNMGDRPISRGGWTRATIEADIDPDIAAINIGFISLDGATVFIDDVSLKVSAEAVATQEPSPPHTLSPRELENVVAASRLVSLVRFFHPSDQAVGIASWDHLVIDILDRAEPAADASDLAHRLSEAFAGIAPTIEIWAGSTEQAPPHAAPELGTTVVYWQHTGAGTISPPNPRQVYRSTVKRSLLSALPGGVDSESVVQELGGGVCCRVPVALPTDDSGTLPHGTTPAAWAQKKADLPKLTALNRSTRLAGVAIAWGVMQHFYPYFDVANTDWKAALPAALEQASRDKDELAYLSTLRELIAKLNDGHGSVHHSSLRMEPVLPLAVQWAGEYLVVVGKGGSVPDSINVGDSIVSIDGKPVEDCYREVSRWISAASDGWRRYVSVRFLTINLPTQDTPELVVKKPDGRLLTVKVARVKEVIADTATGKHPENGAEVAPGIVYFDLRGTGSAALKKAMPALTHAKAIIFDMRGYPAEAARELLDHLIDKPSTSAQWCVPIVRHPDFQGVEWKESHWEITPATPRLTAKAAFLTNSGAISYAESIMEIVEAYKLGEIIGSPTAGTNGNVNPFELPGGYRVSWTGMKVLKHDRSPYHGVGVTPTVPVVPTAKGIAEGRDEVLEKAVEVMRGKISSDQPAAGP